MSEETVTPPTSASATSKQRAWRRVLAAIALVVLGFVGWHYGVELPAERRVAAEQAAKRAANAQTIPDLKLDLVWIAPGEFLMGSPEQKVFARWFYEARETLTDKLNPDIGNDDQRPVTRVTLTKPFWLGRTEVTQAQWTALMGNSPSEFKGDDLPVERVSWNDATEFCRKLTERERAAGRLSAGHEFTLPTEAQWEYACRAGMTDEYAGDLGVMAWYADNSGKTTHPVGTKQANAWGLADMHGNVYEWCRDWWGDFPGSVITDPIGSASGSRRVYRGGSWYGDASVATSTYRYHLSPGGLSFDIGFRVALAPVR